MDIFLLLFLWYYTHQNSLYTFQENTYISTHQEIPIPENTEYCQSVYWYPNALELLQKARCDTDSTTRKIHKAKKG